MLKWHVIATKPGQEFTAARMCPRTKTIQAWCPSYFEIQNKRVVEKPLFSGYILLLIDNTVDSLSIINNVRGTRGVIKFGDYIATIPDNVVKELLDGPARVEDVTTRGKDVVVGTGILTGITAVYSEPDGSKRSMMLLESLA